MIDDREPTFIKLNGEGPFELEIVDEVSLTAGEAVSLLELTTVDGNIVLIPFGQHVLSALHKLTGQALADIGPSGGDTVQ